MQTMGVIFSMTVIFLPILFLGLILLVISPLLWVITRLLKFKEASLKNAAISTSMFLGASIFITYVLYFLHLFSWLSNLDLLFRSVALCLIVKIIYVDSWIKTTSVVFVLWSLILLALAFSLMLCSFFDLHCRFLSLLFA